MSRHATGRGQVHASGVFIRRGRCGGKPHHWSLHWHQIEPTTSASINFYGVLRRVRLECGGPVPPAVTQSRGEREEGCKILAGGCLSVKIIIVPRSRNHFQTSRSRCRRAPPPRRCLPIMCSTPELCSSPVGVCHLTPLCRLSRTS